MEIKVKRKSSLGLQIAPLVDVVFQLLVFFLLASSLKSDRELPTPLPGAASKEVSEKIPTQIEIEIKNDNRIFIRKKEYDSPASTELPQLRQLLKEYAQFFENPMVILLPENKVSYQRVINVLDACFAAKISRISFAATPLSETAEEEAELEE
jgi:biopolymer transport protein ExbD